MGWCTRTQTKPTEARRERARAPPGGTPARWSTCTACATCRKAARWCTLVHERAHDMRPRGERSTTAHTRCTVHQSRGQPPAAAPPNEPHEPQSIFRRSRERLTAPPPAPVKEQRDRRPIAAEPATRAPALPTGRRPTAATRGARGARGALGARGRPAPVEEDDVSYNSAVRRQVPLNTWRRWQI